MKFAGILTSIGLRKLFECCVENLYVKMVRKGRIFLYLAVYESIMGQKDSFDRKYFFVNYYKVKEIILIIHHIFAFLFIHQNC